MNTVIRGTTRKFNFEKVEESEVSKLLKSLPRKSSTGEDDVSYIDLVDGDLYTTKVITWITNMIIETSHWPT